MMKIVGVQKGVSFKIDGKEFRGLNLFGLVERNGVDGSATEKVFVNETKECYPLALTLKVGDTVLCAYNRFGKIDSISVVKA